MVPHFFVDSPASDLLEQLRRAAGKVSRAINREMLKGGVSYSRARILRCLESRGPLRAIDLAQLFEQAPRTITEAIDGLERDGLVTRTVDRIDRRIRRITITAAGQEAVGRSALFRSAFAEEIGETLGAADIMQLSGLLDRLEHHLVARDRTAVLVGEDS